MAQDNAASDSTPLNEAEEHKLVPYRAQICARAVENCVPIVHANAPQHPKTLEGSQWLLLGRAPHVAEIV